MSIMRWDPVREISAAQSEMRRLLEQVGLMGSEGGQRGWMPPMDVLERDDQFVVQMEVPGIPLENLEVEVEDGALTVSGKREQEQREENGRRIRMERRYGSFSRTIPLPQGVDPEAVSADVREGMLEIRVPKPEQQRARRIEIGGGAESARRVETTVAGIDGS